MQLEFNMPEETLTLDPHGILLQNNQLFPRIGERLQREVEERCTGTGADQMGPAVCIIVD